VVEGLKYFFLHFNFLPLMQDYFKRKNIFKKKGWSISISLHPKEFPQCLYPKFVTKPTRDVSHCDLAIYILKYLKAKEECNLF